MPWSLGRSPQPGLGHPGVSLGHPNIWCWALKANKDRVGEAGNLIPTNPIFFFFFFFSTLVFVFSKKNLFPG